ncbi:MAG: hypothetical protein MK116_04275 [Phycisphaerales bacterium]|nr:hypothetical protein [Phycisphaerales bacterium]
MLPRVQSLMALLILGVSSLLLTPGVAQAQRYPFFVQPISVQDLRPMQEELQLSPSQAEAMLTIHETYGRQFNELQEGELKELVDQGISMSRNMNFMGGRNFEIPPRKEIEAVIDAAVNVWDAFERIDNQFFNQVQGLLHEDQLPALERVRGRRKAEAYRTIHLRFVENFNRGAGADLHSMVERLDLTALETEAVHVPMLGYERNLGRLCDRLQDRMLEGVDMLLDEVDRMGVRDMEMMEMMTFFADEERQNDLKAIFDQQSVPLQEASAKISELNWDTYERIYPVLPPDKALDFQERYFRDVYRGSGNDVFKARAFIKRAMDLPSISPERQEQMAQILDGLNMEFQSVSGKMAKAYEKKRAYRTIDEFEDESLNKYQEAIDRYRERVTKMAESATEQVEQLLTEEQLEAANSAESKEEDRGSRWSRRGGGRTGRGGSSSGSSRWQRSSDFPIPPMSKDQVIQFSLWVGVPESEQPLIEILHEGYMSDYEAMAKSYDQDLEARYESIESEEGGRQWLKRRDARVEVTDVYKVKLGERENQFFEEFAISMPEGVDPEIVATIRRAQERARTRVGQQQGDWVLRQRPESFIDVGALVLASDPASIDVETRGKVVDLLKDYEEVVVGNIELLEEQMEKVQSIQQRLWSGEEYEEEVRSKMEELRQKRREELNDTAVRLIEANREVMNKLAEALPEDAGWPLREDYDKAAYPSVFRDSNSLDKTFEEVLQLQSLTPAERQSVEALILDHRSQYRDYTDQMLTLAKTQSTANFSWPPDGGMMDSWMKSEQLQYGRGELNNRTRTRMMLMLGEERAVEVPGLYSEIVGEDAAEAAQVEMSVE